MRPLVAHCHRGLGALYRRTSRKRGFAKHRAVAAALYQSMGMAIGLWTSMGP